MERRPRTVDAQAEHLASQVREPWHQGCRFGRAEGGLPATFQVLYLTAWSPDESQPKPLAPGAARARLAGALDSREISAGEQADPLKKPDPESR